MHWRVFPLFKYYQKRGFNEITAGKFNTANDYEKMLCVSKKSNEKNISLSYELLDSGVLGFWNVYIVAVKICRSNAFVF
ncbi:hypothetical protein QVD17_10562 [Tagetes erecta]|uniref:Uncharacterized protein n=1 Tax=Tagetes erecta TaxID=13708 RepID=A0AAD8L370_TARER|nr:hypothetical protein QVD17_10562 [Tagetes erecta]